MSTTRQYAAALALCALALASLLVATAPAAAQTDGGASNTTDQTDATNASTDLALNASFAAQQWPSSDVRIPDTYNPLWLNASRGNYTVTVHSERLDSSTLADVFADELATDDPDVANFTETSGGVFRMRVLDANASIAANLTDIVTGEYRFRFEAGDDASATATTTVVECACVGAGFYGQGADEAFETGQSGVITVPIRLKNVDEVQVELTGDDTSVTATVTDGDDDRLVTLALNTHLVGRNAPFDDYARSHWTERGVSVLGSEDGVSVDDIGDIPGGDNPLPVDEYDLTVKSGETTLARTTVRVTDPALAGVESRVGPASLLGDASASSLRRAAANGTLSDDAATAGSAVVYEIESSSIFGPLRAAASGDEGDDRYAQALLDVATDRNPTLVPGDVVSFTITGPGNERIDLLNTSRNGGLVVVPDRRNDTLYVGLRADSLAVENGTALGSGETFTASVGVYDQTASEAVQFADGTDQTGTPTPPSPEPPSTPDQDSPSSPDTADSPTPGTVAPPADEPADDPTEQSPAATTTASGPGFGVTALVAALVAVCALAVTRIRD